VVPLVVDEELTMTIHTVITIAVLTFPLWWLFIGGAIYRPRPDGSEAPALLRAIGYDLTAISLAAVAIWWVTDLDDRLLPVSSARAAFAGFALGVGLYALYSKGDFGPLLRAVRDNRRRFAVRGAVTTITSVAEEIAWRGVALASAIVVFGWSEGLALAVTAVLFGLLHFGLGGIRPIVTHTVTGLVFGAAFLLTGALLLTIVAHVTYNLAVTAAQLRLAPAQEEAEAEPVLVLE
jgi:membrane protease YdiL (CAAX protease family)